MFRRSPKLLSGLLLFGLTCALVPMSMASIPGSLTEQVRHRLVMLPYYGVFDNLSFRIEGNDTVVLSGQVTRPVLKSDAEATLRRIEGVGKIINQIEVLPLSPIDNSIRLAAYRAIFSQPGMTKYSIQANPPIKIIVKNGRITLDGVVLNEFDRNIAEIAARGVPLTFGVTNNLRIG